MSTTKVQCVATEEVSVKERDNKIIWRNVIILSVIHLTGLYGMKVLLQDCSGWTGIWGEYINFNDSIINNTTQQIKFFSLLVG